MNELTLHQDLCRRFALLLSYPDHRMNEHTAACMAKLRPINLNAAAALEPFHRFVTANADWQIEEAYTGTFDLQSLCHPYIGYQLCGESQQRTLLMLKLRELYQRFDFTPGNELPDHLTEVLRFIGSINDRVCRLEIIRDGILPALAKMTLGLEDHERPYLTLLQALHCFLSELPASVSEQLPADQNKEYSS